MIREALKYLNNVLEILKEAPVEENRYTDVKYVREVCGTAYLAVLKAIDEYLLKKGVPKKQLPRSVDGYRRALRRYLSIHDGKMLKEFDALYDQLHIAGYYRGLLHNVGVVEEIFKEARAFIEKVSE